jgi:RimJ/RimL family protein N-acetyltransferase
MNIIYQGKTKRDKNITVRYPEMGDLEQLLGYINTLSDEKTFIRYQGEHETLESEKTYLEKRLNDIENKKAVHLLVFHDGKIVGASDIGMHDKTEKHIGLLGISIAKDFRGEGIGTLLMDLVLKEAKRELIDLKIVVLDVYSTNNIARKLYSKIGFKEYGVLPDGVSRNNTFEDTFLMYKNI